MTVTEEKKVSLALDKNGIAFDAAFAPATLRERIEAFVGAGWKKSPKKLLKVIAQSTDLMQAVHAARERLIPEYTKKHEELRRKVFELSAQSLKSIELDEDGLPPLHSYDGKVPEEDWLAFLQSRTRTLRCQRALWFMHQTSVIEWLMVIDDEEFERLVEIVKELLDRPVRATDDVFCWFEDDARGCALWLLLQVSPVEARSFGLTIKTIDGRPCGHVVDKLAFANWCETQHYNFADSSAKSEKKAADAAKPAAKAKTAKAAAKDDKALKAEKASSGEKAKVEQAGAAAEKTTRAAAVKTDVKTVKTQEKTEERPPVKTQAKTAKPAAKTAENPAAEATDTKPQEKQTRRPAVRKTAPRKTAAGTAAKSAVKAPAKPADAAKDPQPKEEPAAVGDLASRLVQNLQIAPSAVAHRSPGRPRKAAVKAEASAEGAEDVPESASTRPAARNRSSSRKA